MGIAFCLQVHVTVIVTIIVITTQQPSMAVNVKFRANGTFMATRVDDPGAIVVSGNVADVAGRINSLIVRGVLFDGVTLGQADVQSILEVDHRVWRNAAWTFKDSRFASRRDAKELFSRPLGRAIAVERCSLADRWDSRWFFSSVAVNSCRTLSIPASIISEGNMPENVDSLVGRLNRTTSGAAQVEPLKLEVHFPLCNAGHRDLFKTLQMRLIQVATLGILRSKLVLRRS